MRQSIHPRKDSRIEVRVAVSGNLFLTIDHTPGPNAGICIKPIHALSLAELLMDAADLATERLERLERQKWIDG